MDQWNGRDGFLYISMYLGQWDVPLDPIKQAVLTEVRIMQNTIVHNCAGGGK